MSLTFLKFGMLKKVLLLNGKERLPHTPQPDDCALKAARCWMYNTMNLLIELKSQEFYKNNRLRK